MSPRQRLKDVHIIDAGERYIPAITDIPRTGGLHQINIRKEKIS